ncbi:MAG TPA: DUF6686 family protein [Chitinophaga sp.]|uniref:DUF6686 family protein n=1 Tax=Chitinophaga sp. TaxID=1869181 RepID=UPI002CFAA3B3|nr:DUF6686 family protein [Chitinophaga sp.]HVI49402.1 DUF6686 family protein [Chitinophaga sp.]
MCNYQTLYQGSNGYVIRCQHCRSLQLAFGTTVVNLSAAEFDCFAVMISRLADEQPTSDHDHEKMICMPLPADHVMMLLTPAEVYKLASMASEVGALLEAYAILDNASSYSTED